MLQSFLSWDRCGDSIPFNLAMAGGEMAQMLDEQLRDVRFVEVGGGEADDGDSRRPMVKCCRSRSFSSPALLLAMAFIGLCVVLNKGSVMSVEAPTFQSVGHYRASELIFVDPTELEARENRLKCHLQPKTYLKKPLSHRSWLWAPQMAVVAMSCPDNHRPFIPIWTKNLISSLSQVPGPVTCRGQLGSQVAMRRSEISWQWLVVATRQLFQPRSWLWWVVSNSSTPMCGFPCLFMLVKVQVLRTTLLRCDQGSKLSKVTFNAMSTRPIALHAARAYLYLCCDKNSLFECATAVVTITDKLGLLQAWMGARPLPGNWVAGWLFGGEGGSWLDGLVPPSFSAGKVPCVWNR